nr:bifunctional diaminohydroxyphosphoribosylaminopyrimidine deaminase/5-amino-6-(5-phosphoribosylamino)uracil reductase RibD [Demetria terragena]
MGQQPPAAADDRAMLARAVECAGHGPIVDPNPRVGAVIALEGRVVGEGFHRGAGHPHAEVAALKAAGEMAAGSTAYVSLEPCSHQGRTGPCTTALLDAGVARVVYAASDPNTEAAGGAEVLRAAGVRCDHVPTPEADAVNRRWAYAMTHGRPFVTWKVAATLDGRVAARDGSSRWITGPAARGDVHTLRAEAGAIVVGTGTMRTDDPSLTVRTPSGDSLPKQPLRVVVGREPVPDSAAIRANDHWLQVFSHDPFEALAAIHRREIRHVLLEGGPTVAAAWLRAGAISEVVAYLAPTVLGSGPALVGDLGISTLSDAFGLELVDLTRVGSDVRLVLRLASPSNTALAQGV